eukprot:5906803-Pyramimonas_sp.AAC.2
MAASRERHGEREGDSWMLGRCGLRRNPAHHLHSKNPPPSPQCPSERRHRKRNSRYLDHSCALSSAPSLTVHPAQYCVDASSEDPVGGVR